MSDEKNKGVAQCYVCQEMGRNYHSHHVWMRARTGELGPLVDLCGSCHTGIHAVATSRVAQLKGGRPNKNNLQWSHSRHPHEIQNAEYLIKHLVIILLTVDTKEMNKLMTLEIPRELDLAIKSFKEDAGLRNKKEVVLACCVETLTRRGYLKRSSVL